MTAQTNGTNAYEIFFHLLVSAVQKTNTSESRGGAGAAGGAETRDGVERHTDRVLRRVAGHVAHARGAQHRDVLEHHFAEPLSESSSWEGGLIK